MFPHTVTSLLLLILSGALASQTPTVDATGESMRLRSATVQGSGNRFSIRAVVDDDNSNTGLPTSYRRWWHFEVRDLPAGATTLDMRIENAGYSDVILPVWSRSTDQRASFGIYERCPSTAVPRVSGSTHTFSLTVPAGVTDIRLAKYFPFTVTRKDELVARVATHRHVRSVQVIGRSVAGRPIELLEITDGTVQDAGKRRVWVHAGIHPAETTSHLTAQGLIDFLLGGSALAELLLDQLIVDVVPMANPDGVALGNYRTNASSVNLEEQWTAPYASTVPEIVALRTAIENRMGTPGAPGSNPIEVLLNLHSSHNVAYPFHFQHVANPSFDLVSSRSGVIPAVNALEQAWIDGLRAESPFVARGSTASSTLGAPRRPYVESMMHDRWTIDPAWTSRPVMAITLEGTYGRGPDGVSWNTEADYVRLGAEVGRALGGFFAITPGGSVRRYGAPCGSSDLSGGFASGPDRLALSAIHMPANAPAFLAWGIDAIATPLPPPSPCVLRTSPLIAVPSTIGPIGIWTTSVVLPVNLSTFRANAQLLAWNGTAWIATNGIEVLFVR